MLRNADGAELDALEPLAFVPPGHQLQDLVRFGVGREVVVPMRALEQRVADAAADEIELVTGRPEAFGQVVHEAGELQQIAQARAQLRRVPTHRRQDSRGARAKR